MSPNDITETRVVSNCFKDEQRHTQHRKSPQCCHHEILAHQKHCLTNQIGEQELTVVKIY